MNVHALAQRHSGPYNEPREVFLLGQRLTELETHVNSTLPHLATKADLKEVEGRLRTEIQKEQKYTRNLLLTIAVAIIGAVIGSNVWGGQETQVVYVPQQPAVSTVEPSVNTISELEELRNRLEEVERVNAMAQPSD